MGRAVNDFHRNRLCGLLSNHGGRVVIGNANAHEDKNLLPTVVMEPSLDSPLMQEEIFGPILPVYPFKDIDDAIKFVVNKEKPLAVYYFGNSKSENARRVEKETFSGAYVTNDVFMHAASSFLPFGGVGYSGYGRYHGFEGFKQMSNAKSVLIKNPMTGWPYSVIFPPFTTEKQQ